MFLLAVSGIGVSEAGIGIGGVGLCFLFVPPEFGSV